MSEETKKQKKGLNFAQCDFDCSKQMFMDGSGLLTISQCFRLKDVELPGTLHLMAWS